MRENPNIGNDRSDRVDPGRTGLRSPEMSVFAADVQRAETEERVSKQASHPLEQALGMLAT